VHAFVLGGQRAGEQTQCQQRDGTHLYHFAFNDRGRGPAIDSRIALDGAGLPLSVQTRGLDYFKSAVEERYERRDGRASWHNKVERGDRRLAAPAFYLSYTSVPAEQALLARALLAAPGQRLALLPAGEARLETLATQGEGAGARTLYALHGLDVNPVTLWLDADGGLFAQIEPFSQLVPEGQESLLPALEAIQQRVLAERRTALAKRVLRRPAGALVIEHARLFDSEAAVMRAGSTVLVEGNTIRAVGADGSVPIPANAERIDARGRTLLPGLWDMHQHPDADDGALLLAAGITGVRDMAAEPEKRAQLAGFDDGSVLGPRVVFAGIVDGRGPFQGPTRMLVDSEDEARAAVREIADARFRQVKVYSSVKPALVPVIVAEAHARGLRVSGHVPAFMTAEQAVRAGYDEIQHLNMLFLNFLFDIAPDTRSRERFIAVAAHATAIDPAEPRVREFIDLLRTRGVVVDPTLQVFENLFTDRPGTLAAAFAVDAARLPPMVRRTLLDGGLPVPEGQDAQYRASFAAMQRMLRVLHEAGVPLVAGTDAGYGFALVRELELYVDAGIPAAEVLAIATRRAAEVAGEGARLGVIEPGYLADMVLVDGDPLARMGDLRRLRLVVKDGALIDPEALWRELGIAPPRTETTP
jgi:imidazolonepropionase-like amidohydrolase